MRLRIPLLALWILCFQCFSFAADRPRRIGLLHEIVAAGELDATVNNTCKQLLKSGPQAAQNCKKLAFIAGGHNVDEQLRIDQDTARIIAKLRTSAEGREGMQAFFEKRNPAWQGLD